MWTFLFQKNYAFLFLILGCTNVARAHLTSNYDFNLGYASYKINAGDDFNRTMDSMSAIEFNYNINIAGPDLAATISLFELLNTDFGPLAFTRLAAGVRWYLLGLNGERVIYDNTVECKLWRSTPFGGFTLGISNLSVDDESEDNIDFSAAFIDARVTGGVEVPVAANWILLGQFGYALTLMGGEETDRVPSVSVNGFTMMAGLRMTGF
jgi:hypothetical protein